MVCKLAKEPDELNKIKVMDLSKYFIEFELWHSGRKYALHMYNRELILGSDTHTYFPLS